MNEQTEREIWGDVAKNAGETQGYMIELDGHFAGRQGLGLPLTWQPFGFGYVFETREKAQAIADAMGGIVVVVS